jgi:membrane-bound lytic murein transglycosylase F
MVFCIDKLFLFIIIFLLASCGTPTNVYDQAPYIEKSDFTKIQTRGTIRILVPDPGENTYLVRRGQPLDHERELIKSFAREHKLTPLWVRMKSAKALLEGLNQGKGDIAIANLTITSARRKKYSFTVPVRQTREVLISSKKDKRKIRRLSQLKKHTIYIRKSSSYWRTAKQYQKKYRDLKIVAVPETMNTLDIIDGVATGKYDLTIADENIAQHALAYQPELHIAFKLTGDRAIGWVTRKRSRKLINALNGFLQKRHLSAKQVADHTQDLAGIKKRRVLRVLTRNDPATYFLWRGQLMGFEYDMMQRYAKKNRLRLEVIVPPTQADLIPWLKQGKGDVIAASLTITEKRKSQGIAFTSPYHWVNETIVSRQNENKIHDLKDLEDRTMTVHKSSSYWHSLKKYQKDNSDFDINPAPANITVREILDKVANNKYDLTVVDSHILGSELTWRNDIKGVLKLGKRVPHGWAVRKNNKKLLQSLNRFIRKEYRGLFYNVTRKKYFLNRRTARQHVQFRSARTGVISPYDNLIKKYAKKYGFDWRLIAAQMFQESKFNPKAKSWAGARGLMQLMPRTARSMGFYKLYKPDVSVHAGVKYLAKLSRRFGPTLPVRDRTWFALASYNAGYGHISDARRLARKKGWDSKKWFGNVEKAVLLLAKPVYYKNARHGYVRGGEPVRYIKNIRDLYLGYTARD